jgi:peptidoglycan hydrolase-like protein with peptidoglycan-binding domain
VLAVVVIAGVSSRAGRGEAGGESSTTASTAAVASSLAPTSTLPPVVSATAAPVSKTSLKSTLGVGSVGDDVKMVQERMAAIGFNPGPVDGEFGQNTKQAVWAFEKLVLGVPRAQATGQVTNETWQRMQDDSLVKPRRPQGLNATHMEIYLPEQVGVVFSGDRPVLVAHISSGTLDAQGQPEEFCEVGKFDTDEKGNKIDPPEEKAICAKSKTPGGVFKFTWRYEGNRQSALGGMTNPVYFNYGIAVHGAINVPLEPASHGCVRLNQTLAKVFPTLVKQGDRVFVWGHDGKQPEDYSKNESLPSFNYADPNATTTTSTTTTTAPTSTKPGPTTTKPTPSSPPTTPPPTTPPVTTAAELPAAPET